MSRTIKFFYAVILILLPIVGYNQSSEIVKLDEQNAYEYRTYYEDGSTKSIVGFYAKKPYPTVESFEAKLKKYKVKFHGDQKEFYPSGQLKEVVVYKKGKVIEFAKHYFEDGEEFAVPPDEIPEFQFDIQEQQVWLSQKIQAIEKKYDVDLQGRGTIALEIGSTGAIKNIKVSSPNESLEKYLLEIGEQIEVTKPAKKNGQNIGTRFAFRLEL